MTDKELSKTVKQNLFYDPTDHSTGKGITWNPQDTFKKDWYPDDYTDKIDWSKIVKNNKNKEPKIYREIDETEYLIITAQRLNDELGEMTKEIMKRINHWVITCINCGYKGVLTEFSNISGSQMIRLSCPKCSSKAVGISRDEEHKLIKTILRGSENDD